MGDYRDGIKTPFLLILDVLHVGYVRIHLDTGGHERDYRATSLLYISNSWLLTKPNFAATRWDAWLS